MSHTHRHVSGDESTGFQATVTSVPNRLCVLTVHAHPDDESSKGAGTIARYAAEGIHTVLVCCTGGEEGDVLNPGLKDDASITGNLPSVRRAELETAASIIGYDELVWLGYRDSGMPDSEANSNPDNFAQAPLEEAIERLVAIIRRARPQVIVTYADNQKGYPHPDHLRVHDISIPAFDRAGDPESYPGAGEPWQPLKLYYTVWSKKRVVETHQAFLDRDLESPYDAKWLDRPGQDSRITTQVAVDNSVRRQALLAHQTQVDPTSKFWFGLPTDVMDRIHPFDDYVLARSLVDVPEREDDLFAGIRSSVPTS